MVTGGPGPIASSRTGDQADEGARSDRREARLPLRRIVFWVHLVAGLVAGVVIAVMAFTGAALAFEQELVAWAERDVRLVAPPGGGAVSRQSLDKLRQRMLAAAPELRHGSLTISRDPRAAVAFSSGRDTAYYVDTYTGAVRGPGSSRMAGFMRVMESWHRFLGLGGGNRPLGKAVTGACNLAFLLLAVSGLYLWWPRSWSWRGFKAIALLNWKLAGRARDFNWHNVIGLWCAPILIVLTLTAIPISYRWGSALIYRLVGEEPPAQGVRPGPAGAIAPPSPDAPPAGDDAIIARVQAAFPAWQQITIRSAAEPRGRGTARAPTDADAAGARGRASSRDHSAAPVRDEPGVPPVTVVVREAGAWPRTATTTLAVDPFTAEIMHREAFADLSTGRRLRSWTRFLHTGQALGWTGQLVAALGCIGGLFLVYTGVALAWRRFVPGRPRVATRARTEPASIAPES